MSHLQHRIQEINPVDECSLNTTNARIIDCAIIHLVCGLVANGVDLVCESTRAFKN